MQLLSTLSAVLLLAVAFAQKAPKGDAGGVQTWAFAMSPTQGASGGANFAQVAQYGAVSLYAACFWVSTADAADITNQQLDSYDNDCSQGQLYTGYFLSDSSRADLTVSNNGFFPSPVTSQPGCEDCSSPDYHCDTTGTYEKIESVSPKYTDQYYYDNAEGDVFQYHYTFGAAAPTSSPSSPECYFSGYAVGTGGWNTLAGPAPKAGKAK